MKRFNVRKVAVLGAGVMGAQIAAHLVNVKVPVILFDLPAKEGPKNGIVAKAVENLKKLKPAPLGIPEEAALIEQANYEEHLDKLKECDLVIEAIAERMDWKLDLYRKVAPAIAPHAIVASNTSGLSITKLSEVLPEEIKPRFCGIHFFNPPRYMALVELIATPTTEPEVLDQLEAFVTTALGKSVVRAKDTPNFIANRVGIAGMLATMKEAETYGLSYDVVDDLTGKKLGRASSGTFRATRSSRRTRRGSRSPRSTTRCPRSAAHASAASTSSTRRATCTWSSSSPRRRAIRQCSTRSRRS